MIQPLKSSKVLWILHWLDLEEPARCEGGFFLPTVVFVTDGGGRLVGPPSIVEELDQARVENHLLRLFDSEGMPDRLIVRASPDWQENEWESFGKEQKVEIRIQNVTPAGGAELAGFAASVAARLGTGPEAVPPAELARGLVRSAMGMHSTVKRETQLRRALALDAGCSSARIELADLEFNRGNWKACLAGYDLVIQEESRRWKNAAPAWWEDRTTRPYLRAIYGRAMALWHRGRFAEAAEELIRLLGINPRDNQGARFFVPLLHLLAEDFTAAAEAFRAFEVKYPGDFSEPAYLFGWGLSLSIEGDEAAARAKYLEGMLRNIYIAPLLLEESPPRQPLWLPNDRAEYSYASEFLDSYAVLWDREGGGLRLVREAWLAARPAIDALIAHRVKMLDLQDQRYEPDYKQLWQKMIEEDERLSTPGVTIS